jgi:hypothetical protein
MHPVPSIGLALALERERAVVAQTRRASIRREAEIPQLRPSTEAITLRRARAADAAALSTLAQLDGASPDADRLSALARDGGEGAVLVAEAGGTIVAALDLTHGLLVADPFRHTFAAAELLRERARQLEGGRSRRGWFPLAARLRARPS